MVLGGHVNGLFVSTAPRFSLAAKRAVALAEERNIVESIRLFDSSRLVDVCKLTAHRTPPPWRQFALSEGDPPFDLGDDSYFAFSTKLE
jgi:hypothetical protein